MPVGGNGNGGGGGGAAASLRVAQFDRVACVFRYVASEAVVAEVFVQLWPLLQRGFVAVGADERCAPPPRARPDAHTEGTAPSSSALDPHRTPPSHTLVFGGG